MRPAHTEGLGFQPPHVPDQVFPGLVHEADGWCLGASVVAGVPGWAVRSHGPQTQPLPCRRASTPRHEASDHCRSSKSRTRRQVTIYCRVRAKEEAGDR